MALVDLHIETLQAMYLCVTLVSLYTIFPFIQKEKKLPKKKEGKSKKETEIKEDEKKSETRKHVLLILGVTFRKLKKSQIYVDYIFYMKVNMTP